MLYRLSFISILVLSTTNVTVFAQERIDSGTLNCSALQKIIVQRGQVLVTHSGSYDRAVSNPGFCMRDEIVRALVIPAEDSRSCSAGYYCGSNEGDRK